MYSFFWLKNSTIVFGQKWIIFQYCRTICNDRKFSSFHAFEVLPDHPTKRSENIAKLEFYFLKFIPAKGRQTLCSMNDEWKNFAREICTSLPNFEKCRSRFSFTGLHLPAIRSTNSAKLKTPHENVAYFENCRREYFPSIDEFFDQNKRWVLSPAHKWEKCVPSGCLLAILKGLNSEVS